MKDEKACIAKHWPEAFQIAIKQSMQVVRVKGKKRRIVNLSEDERMAMFHFYRQNVKDDRAMAVEAIGMNARRATARSPLFSAGICVAILAFLAQSIFKKLAYPALLVLLSALAGYVWYAARQRAAQIWQSGRRENPAEALTKMCAALASPLKSASYPVLGGLIAAIGVALYMIIFQ